MNINVANNNWWQRFQTFLCKNKAMDEKCLAANLRLLFPRQNSFVLHDVSARKDAK